MTDQREYAEKRESGRAQSVLIFAGFVAALGVGAALRAHGVLAVAILVFVGTALVYCAVFLLTPVKPNRLQPVSPHLNEGEWSATTPLMTFSGSSAADARRTGEVFGRVRVGAAGVDFQPTARSSRFRGVQALRWDLSWRIEARRLRGPSGLVQLSVISKDDDESVTFWLRGAKSFKFESPAA
jgi:hypothetical protein